MAQRSWHLRKFSMQILIYRAKPPSTPSSDSLSFALFHCIALKFLRLAQILVEGNSNSTAEARKVGESFYETLFPLRTPRLRVNQPPDNLTAQALSALSNKRGSNFRLK